jgi:3-oxoacyl-[acyl-carrier protein] reductase
MIEDQHKLRKALVTGGSRGIGAAISIELAKAGSSVAIIGRNQIDIDKQLAKLRQLKVEAIGFSCDVLDKAAIEETWKKIQIEWGGVDILINNVGGGGRWGHENILETPIETWEEVLQKNLGVATQLIMNSLPYMIEKKWGRIVTITSIYGATIGGRPWFNVAKVAQTTLTKNLSRNKDLTRNGITINSVAPGAVFIEKTGWDEMFRKSPEEFKNFTESLPLGRMGTPEEVAALVGFICSDNASYLNGSSITIDGGESSSLI